MNFDDWSDVITKNWKQTQEQYWSMMNPQMPNQADDVMKRAMDMSKSFAQFAEDFTKTNNNSTNPLESWLAGMEQGFINWPTMGPQNNLLSMTELAEKYRESMKAYEAAFSAHGLDALQALRERMAKMEKDGGSIKSLRELYELWVDVSEEVYAKFAMSKQFQDVYSNLVNTFVAFKSEMDSVVGSQLNSFNMPTQQALDDLLKALQQEKRDNEALRKRIKALETEKSVTKPTAKKVSKPAKAKKASKPTAAIKPAKAKKTPKPAAVTKPDDLTKVKGIGPRLQERLALAGIKTFKQLAAVSPEEAVDLDTRLELQGRVLRDGWISQAAQLQGKS